MSSPVPAPKRASDVMVFASRRCPTAARCSAPETRTGLRAESTKRRRNGPGNGRRCSSTGFPSEKFVCLGAGGFGSHQQAGGISIFEVPIILASRLLANSYAIRKRCPFKADFQNFGTDFGNAFTPHFQNKRLDQCEIGAEAGDIRLALWAHTAATCRPPTTTTLTYLLTLRRALLASVPHRGVAMRVVPSRSASDRHS